MRQKRSGLPKYVYKQVVKGRTYYRFRRAGGGAVRIPGKPGTSEFHTAYAKLLTDPIPDAGRYNDASVAFFIEQYFRSAEFTNLKPGTQRDYQRYLRKLDAVVGSRPITEIGPDFIADLMSEMRDVPGTANHALAVLRTFFRYAKKRKAIKLDPTEGAERFTGREESYERWPAEALQAFRKSAPPMMRLALELGLYTGQRLSDVIALRWEDYDGKCLHLTQQKTGAEMAIPVHGDLAKLLKKTPRHAKTILAGRSGKPFHPRVFSRDFRDARIKAGLPDGLSFHGLRHTAASTLAELGATASEIQAITGHKSLKQVEHYIRQADQRIQAERAIARLPSAKRSSKPARK